MRECAGRDGSGVRVAVVGGGGAGGAGGGAGSGGVGVGGGAGSGGVGVGSVAVPVRCRRRGGVGSIDGAGGPEGLAWPGRTGRRRSGEGVFPRPAVGPQAGAGGGVRPHRGERKPVPRRRWWSPCLSPGPRSCPRLPPGPSPRARPGPRCPRPVRCHGSIRSGSAAVTARAGSPGTGAGLWQPGSRSPLRHSWLRARALPRGPVVIPRRGLPRTRPRRPASSPCPRVVPRRR